MFIYYCVSASAQTFMYTYTHTCVHTLELAPLLLDRGKDHQQCFPHSLLVKTIHSPAAGLGLLRQVGKSKVQHVPTLGMVIPYLELSSKQEYLVHRIKGQYSKGTANDLRSHFWHQNQVMTFEPQSDELHVYSMQWKVVSPPGM